VIVGITPASAASERPALLDAVGRLFPVRFLPLGAVDGSNRDLSALVTFRQSDDPRPVVPSGLPTLTFEAAARGSTTEYVSFTHSLHADARLRGKAILAERSPHDGGNRPGFEPLAAVGRAPVWEACSTPGVCQVVSAELPELADGECLRDRLTPGRCLAMIALLHFLRGVCAEDTWTPPPLRASIIIDDPNLRRPTYGYVDFGQLARHAEVHDYHIGFAHVPLDFRFFHRATVRLFRSAARRLSLTVHGNNHAYRELEAVSSDSEADRLLAQALRRTQRFENQSGLRVGRVMVPPHEACSAAIMRGMSRLGFEAVSLTRPYGYLYAFGTASPYAAPGDRSAGFNPAEMTEYGMPVITRRMLDEHGEILLRAFLDQPIVLYGHASDLRAGLDLLESAAATVNDLPDVVWSDLSTLSRSNYLTRRNGGALHVRAFARALHIEIPPEVTSVVLEPLVMDRSAETREFRQPADNRLQVPDWGTSRISVARSEQSGSKLEVEFVSPTRLDPERVPAPRPQPAAVLRRAVTEARDRARPLLDGSRRR
jgi:hypothetical protein